MLLDNLRCKVDSIVDEERNTALHTAAYCAARWNDRQVVDFEFHVIELLVESGGGLHVKNAKGETPLETYLNTINAKFFKAGRVRDESIESALTGKPTF